MVSLPLGRMVEIMIDRQATLDVLRQKEMVVHFTKKNGEERIMTCTLSPNFIPEDNLPKGTSTKEPKPLAEQTACSVYDIEAKGWRSFLWDNVTEIKDIDTAMAQTLSNLQYGSKKYYRVQIYGYGGELVYHNISKQAFDYWKDKDEETITDYVLNDDAETVDVPAEADFAFEDGYRRPWYELDGVAHDNGASEGAAYIQIEQVEDESYSAKTIKEIYDGGFNDFVNLVNDGDFDTGPSIGGDLDLTLDQIENEEPYLFYGVSSEKGGFFEGMIITNEEFNPRHLEFSLTEYPNGDNIIHTVKYKGEDVDNNGGDTNGKGYYFGVIQW